MATGDAIQTSRCRVHGSLTTAIPYAGWPDLVSFDEGISRHDMYTLDPVHRVIYISPNTKRYIMQNLHIFAYCQNPHSSSDHHISVSTQLKQPVRLVHLHGRGRLGKA